MVLCFQLKMAIGNCGSWEAADDCIMNIMNLSICIASLL